MASISFAERTNADGSFTVTVRYRDAAGTQRKRSFRESSVAKTRKAAKDYSARLRVQLADGDYVDPTGGKRRFGEVALEWLNEANPSKRESAWTRDEIVVRVHLEPIKDLPIGRVQPKDVRALVADWGKVLAPRTVHRNYGVLRAICSWAVAEDLIRRSPCRGISLPSKGGAQVGRVLSADDLVALASEMAPEHQTMVWVMALLGLRWGEAAALRVGSIRFGEPSILEVTETVQRGRGGRVFVGPPKSDAGNRRLVMPDALTALLRDQISRRGLTESDRTDHLFVNAMGGLWEPTNWRRRIWQPAAFAAGLGTVVEDSGKRRYEGVTPHDLRRTNATAMVGADVDVKTAQTRLGHSDVRMTLDVYARAQVERDQAAADALPLRDAFAVLFFVAIGMLFDYRTVLDMPFLVIGIVAVIIIVKPVAALINTLISGYSLRTSLTVAGGLAQIGEFSFILAALAVSLNLIPGESHNVLVAGAIISISLNPWIFRSFLALEPRLNRIGWLNSFIEMRGGRSVAKANLKAIEHEPKPSGVRSIVVGYGPVGQNITKILYEFGIEPTIIELNIDTVLQIQAEGHHAIYGDASRSEILEVAGIATAKYLVVTMPHSEMSLGIIHTAREENPEVRILARARFLHQVKGLEHAGTTIIRCDEAEAANALAEALLQDIKAPQTQIEAVIAAAAEGDDKVKLD